MKYLLNTFLILLFCSCNGQNYKIEKQLFYCLASSAEAVGIDLQKEIQDFENHLIASGVLKDGNGESYYQILKKIEEDESVNFVFKYSFFDTLQQHSKSNYSEGISADCQKLIQLEDSKSFKKSKLYAMQLAMDSIEITGDLRISNVAKKYTNVLSPKDFEQDYYKLMIFSFLNILQSSDMGFSNGFKKTATPEDRKIPMIKKRNALIVDLQTDKDSICFNSQKIAVDNIALILKDYILGDSSDISKPDLKAIYIENLGNCYQSMAIVSLNSREETPYSTYLKTQNQLLKAFEMARNEKAMYYFKKEFNELGDAQQEAIKELVPIAVLVGE